MPTLNQRSLTSLTPQECQTLFAVAFGYAPPLDLLDISHLLGQLSFGDHSYGMTLDHDGMLLAWRSGGDEPVMINVRKLISYLDAMNVAFGPYGDQPVPTVQFHEKAPSGSIS